jgi:hypothetical protein
MIFVYHHQRRATLAMTIHLMELRLRELQQEQITAVQVDIHVGPVQLTETPGIHALAHVQMAVLVLILRP